MRTQKQILLDHLKRGERVTRCSAMRELAIGNLTARISDLRRDGYNIGKDMLKRRNRLTGHPVAFARYYLEEL